MNMIVANAAGAVGLAAGFMVFTNLSLQHRHTPRYMAFQFLLLFLPLLVLALWVQMPASEALIMGATGGAIALFFAVGLTIVRRLDHQWNQIPPSSEPRQSDSEKRIP